jgi:hypothetical protein
VWRIEELIVDVLCVYASRETLRVSRVLNGRHDQQNGGCLCRRVVAGKLFPRDPITVINQSDHPLENVVLTGSGFVEDIGTVSPNAASRVLVRPRGESGLQIRFDASGRTVSFGPEGYFEGGGGYVVIATVSPALAVSIKSELAY